MRVLIIHSPYLSGAASGENRVVDDETRLLREAGHEVTTYLPERQSADAFGRVREGMSAVWSWTATRQVRDLISKNRPDIIHCHNLFPALSPGTLRAADRAGVTIVMTLHNYRLLCLPATFLREGKICEECMGRLPWRGVVHRCYRNSTAASASLATSLSVHRSLGTFDLVDLYMAVSDFVRDKHAAAGFTPNRLVTKPNFAWARERRTGAGEFFLYAGRLAAEKDVRTVLEAVRTLNARLVVVGDGPASEMLRREAPAGVEFRGTVSPEEVSALVGRARAVLMPSVSYEGAPRSVLEAFAAGVPVIANALGALPEIVDDGTSGVLVAPRDPPSMARALEQLMDDSESLRLGEGAWAAWENFYGPGRGLSALENAYELALRNRAQR